MITCWHNWEQSETRPAWECKKCGTEYLYVWIMARMVGYEKPYCIDDVLPFASANPLIRFEL